MKKINSLQKIHQFARQKGAFLLAEMSIVSVITSMGVAAALIQQKNALQTERYQAQGELLKTLSNSLDSYIASNYITLTSNTNAIASTGTTPTGGSVYGPNGNSTTTYPVSNFYAPTIPELIAAGFLPTGFSTTALVFASDNTKASYKIKITPTNTTATTSSCPNCNLQGLAYLDKPVKTNEIKELGVSIAAIGANGLYSAEKSSDETTDSTKLYGRNGSTQRDNPVTNTPGILAASTDYSTSGLSNFVRYGDNKGQTVGKIGTFATGTAAVTTANGVDTFTGTGVTIDSNGNIHASGKIYGTLANTASTESLDLVTPGNTLKTSNNFVKAGAILVSDGNGGTTGGAGNITATGAITGGSLYTGSSDTIAATASGTGAALRSDGSIYASSAIQGNSLFATGTSGVTAISTTNGNITSTSGNLYTGNIVSSTGAINTATGATGAALRPDGSVYASSNIYSTNGSLYSTNGNLYTGNIVSSTGAINTATGATGAALRPDGSVYASSNIYSTNGSLYSTNGNLYTGNIVTSTGAINTATGAKGAALRPDGSVYASSNIYSTNGNLYTGNIVTSTGAINTATGATGAALRPDGSVYATGGVATTAITVGNATSLGNGTINATGDVRGASFTTSNNKGGINVSGGITGTSLNIGQTSPPTSTDGTTTTGVGFTNTGTLSIKNADTATAAGTTIFNVTNVANNALVSIKNWTDNVANAVLAVLGTIKATGGDIIAKVSGGIGGNVIADTNLQLATRSSTLAANHLTGTVDTNGGWFRSSDDYITSLNGKGIWTNGKIVAGGTISSTGLDAGTGNINTSGGNVYTGPATVLNTPPTGTGAALKSDGSIYASDSIASGLSVSPNSTCTVLGAIATTPRAQNTAGAVGGGGTVTCQYNVATGALAWRENTITIYANTDITTTIGTFNAKYVKNLTSNSANDCPAGYVLSGIQTASNNTTITGIRCAPIYQGGAPIKSSS